MNQQLIANRFRVLSELGRGGMGVVYRVEDTLQADKVLALKMIQVTGSITAEQRLRFKEEFRSMVKLKHPNTIEVFDYGHLDDQAFYLTMEIVPGCELTDLCRNRPMPLDQVYPLLIQLLQALGFIHSRLYVHRDIKAENIRVREDGTLKLMDFGLMDQLGVPSNGKITGTPAYLPPEVPKGGVINASSDLYSVGCLAYEMLTGRTPFTGSLLEVVKAHIDVEPEPISRLQPCVPERLEAIVMRLLAKDQGQRYQQASAVIEDLTDLAGIKVAGDKLEQKTSYLTSSALVGRDDEMALLEADLKDVMAGQGRATFVGAPAGIGKSRMVQELVLQAKLNDMPVLHGQCLESGMTPYEPLKQALRPVIALSTREELEKYGPVLAKLLPELLQHDIAPTTALSGAQEKQRLHDTVVEWLRSVSARTPLVIFFDDLQWADLQSLDVYNHGIRQLRSNPVYFLSTFRNDEAPPSSPLWFTINEELTRYLGLGAFNLAQTMMLIRAMLHDVQISKEFSEFLFDATAGNCFFITEVLRYLMEEGALTLKEGVWHFPAHVGNLEMPTSVEATVLRRLRQLSPEALDLARVCSVLGRYQELDMLLEVSGFEDDELFNQIDEVLERQFLLKDGDRYTFPHDRVREALYEDMPADQRRDIHERCGVYLEARYGERKDQITSELAYHFSRGHNLAKAYENMHLAGNRAMRDGAPAVAMENWKKAAQILDGIDYPDKERHQVDLWWWIGAVANQGWQIDGVEALSKLLPVLEAQGDADALATILRYIYRRVLPKLPEARREAILRRLTNPKPYRHRIRTAPGARRTMSVNWLQALIVGYGYLGCSLGVTGNPLRGLEMNDRARKLMPFTGTRMDGLVYSVRAVGLNPAGYYDEVQSLVKKSSQLLTEDDIKSRPDLAAAWSASWGAMMLVSYQGQKPDREILDYVTERCDKYGIGNLKSFYWGRYAIWYAYSGRSAEALEFVEMMDQNSRKIGGPPYQWSLYLRAFIHCQRGEFDEAMAIIVPALKYGHVLQDAHAMHFIRILKGHVHLGMEDLDAAWEEFTANAAFGRERSMLLIMIQALIGQGRVALARGDAETARARLEEALAAATEGEGRNPLHQAIAIRELGNVARAQNEPERALARYEEALAIVSRPEQDNPMEQGITWRAIGELHLANDASDKAWHALQQAAELFHGLKNRYLQRTVTPQLDRLSQPARKVVSGGASTPAASETPIAQMRTLWGSAFATAAGATQSENELYEKALAVCIDSLRATEVSLHLVRPEWRLAASLSASGAKEPPRCNPSFLEQVRQEMQPLAAIDMPENMAFNGSQLLLEIPSVLLVPLKLGGQLFGVLYLAHHDLSAPYGDEDFELATALCEVLSQELEQRRVRQTQALERLDSTRLTQELRLSIESLSLHEHDRADLLQNLLRECAERLRVDEISVVVKPLDPQRLAHHPTGREPAPINLTFVADALEHRQSFCGFDLPEALNNAASNLELRIPSVAVSPMAADGGMQAALYCVRHDMESPLDADDLQLVETCANILGEALTSLGGEWASSASAS